MSGWWRCFQRKSTTRCHVSWQVLIVAVMFLGLTLPVEGKKTTRQKRSRQKTETRRAPDRKPVETFSLRSVDLEYPLDQEGRRLAQELANLWTRDADRLVSVVQSAQSETIEPAPLTLLLAIAHAETNGRILLVSEAGAVGLAQATPIAYLTEGLEGKLFMTANYVEGARAYIMKKPLHDADRIATLLIEDMSLEGKERARDLLDAAYKYRREGVAELEILAPYAASEFLADIERDDRNNLRILDELSDLLESDADPVRLTRFRDEARACYRSMRDLQHAVWKIYQQEIVAERDAVLRRTFNMDPAVVIQTLAYEASETLARELDDRFSPRKMARFLNDHVLTKFDEAYQLGLAEEAIERTTAGLYNGGSHNIKRMLAGLIADLPETRNYMRKVPATRRKLDATRSSRLDTGGGEPSMLELSRFE